MPKCKIKITLDNVRYFGNNIGDDWYFNVVVSGDGAFTAKQEFYTKQIKHLSTMTFNDVLVDTTTDNCVGPNDGLYTLTFAIKAVEIDHGRDDHGNKTETRTIECSYDDYMDLNVLVQEREKGFFGWLLNRHRRARLTFKFHIELQCI